MMTGEMFALLGEVSILRHTVGISDWSEDDFAAAVAEAHAAPADCLGRLFGLRAGPLLFGDAAPSGSARLSGLLIGAEIATGMAERYAAALTALGIDFGRADAEDAVRNGLFAMAARIWPERELLETNA